MLRSASLKELHHRIHAKVQAELQKRTADVLELHLPMTPAMRDIQQALLECIELTLNEIRRANTGVRYSWTRARLA